MQLTGLAGNQDGSDHGRVQHCSHACLQSHHKLTLFLTVTHLCSYLADCKAQRTLLPPGPYEVTGLGTGEDGEQLVEEGRRGEAVPGVVCVL